MDTRENLNSIYREKVEEIQGAFADAAKSILASHFNYIIKKYGNWKKYPRKIKKYLKKKELWFTKDLRLFDSEDFIIKPSKNELPTFTFENFKL